MVCLFLLVLCGKINDWHDSLKELNHQIHTELYVDNEIP